jgi:hypothetical protein
MKGIRYLAQLIIHDPPELATTKNTKFQFPFPPLTVSGSMAVAMDVKARTGARYLKAIRFQKQNMGGSREMRSDGGDACRYGIKSGAH